MGLLNFESENRRKIHFPEKWKKFRNKILCTSAAVGIISISSTLAAGITLNSGSVVEFGQGMSTAVACSGDTELTLIPASSFQNAPGSDTYNLTGLTVGNVPTSCYGKEFMIKAYGPSSSTPLPLFRTSSTDIVVYNDGGNFVRRGSSNNNATGLRVVNTNSGEFYVEFVTPVATTDQVSKLTVESTNYDASTYYVGDIGPGGGIVFYKSVSGFTAANATCNTNCHYLEYAPENWRRPDSQMTWSADTTNSVAGMVDGYGKGSANTQLMKVQANAGDSTNNVALLALSYGGTDGSVGQWYVPSSTEVIGLLAFSQNDNDFGGLIDQGWYWTSTQEPSDPTMIIAAAHRFGSFVSAPKSWLLYLRPVRAF